jgi:hypothetical protein
MPFWNTFFDFKHVLRLGLDQNTLLEIYSFATEFVLAIKYSF